MDLHPGREIDYSSSGVYTIFGFPCCFPSGLVSRLFRFQQQDSTQIIPASDPNGRFVTSLGFSSVRTSWAFRPLGLLGLSSVGTYGAFRLLGLLGLFVC